MDPVNNNQNNTEVPVENKLPETNQDIQLEKETPMDLTVIETPKPDVTNTENFSIAPQVQQKEEVPTIAPTQTIFEAPIPQKPENTITETKTETTSSPEPISLNQTTPLIETQVKIQEEVPTSTTSPQTPNPLQNLEFSSSKQISTPNFQKIVIIAGALIGVILVVGVGFIFFSTNPKKDTSPVTTQPVTSEATPAVSNQIQEEVKLSLSEYQSIVNEIDTATNNILVKYPINLSQNKIDPESVRFASEELFANYQKINNLNVPDNAKQTKSSLAATYQTLYQSYDLVLKTFKETNTITPDVKAQFTKDYNLAISNLKLNFQNIKNLK